MSAGRCISRSMRTQASISSSVTSATEKPPVEALAWRAIGQFGQQARERRRVQHEYDGEFRLARGCWPHDAGRRPPAPAARPTQTS